MLFALILLCGINVEVGKQVHIPIPKAVKESKFFMRPEAPFLPAQMWGSDQCVIIFTPPRKGTYYLFVTYNDGGEVFDIVAGSPTPDPEPEPEPEPEPDNPPPLAQKGIVILFESSEVMKEGHYQIIYGTTTTLPYLDQKWPYLFADKDATVLDEKWKPAFTPKSSYPWLIVSNGKTGWEGPLPETPEAFLELVKKYDN